MVPKNAGLTKYPPILTIFSYIQQISLSNLIFLTIVKDNADARLRDMLKDAYEKELPRCGFCEETAAHVQFLPCAHRNACAHCCGGWKKCSCGAEIVEKVDVLAAPKRAKRPAEDVSQEIKRLKEGNTCPICLDRPKAMLFNPCGHTACEVCSPNIRTCHLCRKTVVSKVKIF